MMKKITSTALIAYLLLGSTPVDAQTTNEPMLFLAPHCTEEDRDDCESFDVKDPQTLITGPLAVGDLLDIDVVLRTPEPGKVAAVRSWLSYHPGILEARSVELTDAVTLPMPGEQDIDASRGLVRIGGGTEGKLKDIETPIARITFRVLMAQPNAMISFVNFFPDNSGETSVIDATQTPLLVTEPAKLELKFVEVQSSSSSSTSSSSSSTSSGAFDSSSSSVPSSSSTSSSTDESSTFKILQIQNLRITSQGDSLFIGWDPLRSTELTGYNVYYGTVSGRYIQRRGLGTDSTSLVVRNLETGVQYFVAVRGFNANNDETAFSQEASVVIGRPETSTAPLSANQIENVPDSNPVETRGGETVTGETGMSETLIVLLGIAAMVGTALAWRRQLTFASHEKTNV